MARGRAEGVKEEFKVLQITTLGMENDKTAKEMLEKTAWQVQPIMNKRKWKVGLLTEMPIHVMDRAGDNWNRGQKVRIKLRRPDGSFEMYEHVLLVMLHELCHNEFGPHSASFYKLLDEIQAECEELMAKGVGGQGTGFDAPGQKLGHRGGWGVTPKDAHAAAAAAAEKRAQFQAVMGGGGRLGGAGGGGSVDWRSLSPAEAARRAAERRAAAERFAQQNGLQDDAHSGDDEGDGDDGDAQRRQAGAAAGPSARVAPPARAGGGDAARAAAASRAAGGVAGGRGGAARGRGLGQGPLRLGGGVGCVCGQACKEACEELIILDDAEASQPRSGRGGGGARAAVPAAAARGRERRAPDPGARSREPEVIELLSSDDEEDGGAGRAGAGASGRGGGPTAGRGDQGGSSGTGARAKREREGSLADAGGQGRGRGGGPPAPALGAGFWECRVCTLATNPEAESRCQACETWRYATAQLGAKQSRFTRT